MMKLFVFLALVGTTAHGAGFEKGVLWSGREAGYAGASLSRITSAESLYFNPAGLAGGEVSDAVLNVSPTSLKLEGPIASTTKVEETDKNFSLLGGAFARYKVLPHLGIGIGAYVAGGSKAIYEDVNLNVEDSRASYTPTIKTDLKIMEYSIGAGLEVVPGLRLGAAWRIAQVDGSFSTIKKISNTVYSYVDVEGAKQTKYDGFRLGAQYENPEHSWGVGATFRNNFNFLAEGTASGTTTNLAANTQTIPAGSQTKLGTSLPWSASLGGNALVTDHLRLLAAVDMVKYSRNNQLTIQGTLGTTAIPNLPLNWKDMWNYRLGAEYSALHNLDLRAGYILTSRVTSKTDARATLAPPGAGHTFTVGAGTALMDNRLGIDGALEYAFNSGNGSETASATTTKELTGGIDTEYKARSLGAHAAVSYRF